MGLKGRIFGNSRPAWVDRIGADGTGPLDLRPLLARGEEPLPRLIELSADIEEGDGFAVDAPFDPVPLRRMLERAGFRHHAEQIAEKHWRIWFQRHAGPAGDAGAAAQAGARIWNDAGHMHIDVRGLEPPEPMLAVISLLETPAVEGPVTVYLDREPIFLFPELAERGWSWDIADGKDGEVRLDLRKETT